MCECVRDTLGDYKAQLSEHHFLSLLRYNLNVGGLSKTQQKRK